MAEKRTVRVRRIQKATISEKVRVRPLHRPDFRWPDVNEIKEEQKKWLKEEDLLFIHVDIATVIFIQMIVIYSV